jgi:hypothetical protein
VSRCMAFCANDVIVVPRHAVAGRKSVEVVWEKTKYLLADTSYRSKFMPDQCWFRVPAGLKGMNNSQRVYREPKKGESVLIRWKTNGVSHFTVGPVGDECKLGKNRDLRVRNYHGSTVDGTCGAVYTALSDGAIVGFHGIGADHPSVVPQFYPCSPGWSEEIKSWSKVATEKHGDDITYAAEQKKELNIHLPPVAAKAAVLVAAKAAEEEKYPPLPPAASVAVEEKDPLFQ